MEAQIQLFSLQAHLLHRERAVAVENQLLRVAQNQLAIAIGGALGAVARYLSVAYFAKSLGVTYPWGTLLVNVAGSFVMGVLVILFAATDWLPENIKMLATVGFLGSYTTFSTFSLDTMNLLQAGFTSQALLYMAASLIVCVAACAIGLLLARGLVT